MVKQILFFLIVLHSTCSIVAQSSEWSTSWSDTNGYDHPVNIMIHNDISAAKQVPVAVYITNMDVPRIGTDGNQTLLEDLLAQKMLVIVLDASNISTESPDFEKTIHEFYTGLKNLIADATENAVSGQMNHIYFIPEGYRLQRDLSFWDIIKHSSHGTLDFILDVYNRRAWDHDYHPVNSWEKMRGPDGSEIHFDLRMDIIHPSGEDVQKVPLVAFFATQSLRTRTFTGNSERLYYPVGFAADGYAIAFIDHNYIPLARHEYFGHFNPFSLDQWNGLASATAAIRFLRAHAGEFNLNGRIGAVGHSKSSYSVVRLADPNHHKQDEGVVFHNFPSGSPEPQPWMDFESTINVAYTSMGGGTRRISYFNSQMVPLLTAAGKHDYLGEWNRFPRLVRTLQERDVHHLALWMEDQGHTFPVGTDLKTGQDRYILFRRWFDQNLHPHNEDHLEVLYVITPDDTDYYALDAKTRVLPEEHVLPAGTAEPVVWGNYDNMPFDAVEDMKYISRHSPITVGFARSIDLETVVSDEAMFIRNVYTGDKISGSWQARRQNSRFEFITNETLTPGSEYVLVVTTVIADKQGRRLLENAHSSFRTQLRP